MADLPSSSGHTVCGGLVRRRREGDRKEGCVAKKGVIESFVCLMNEADISSESVNPSLHAGLPLGGSRLGYNVVRRPEASSLIAGDTTVENIDGTRGRPWVGLDFERTVCLAIVPPSMGVV